MPRDVRPGIYVGLGGSGMRVALQIKRLFLERFGEVPPVFRILVFDTDDERKEEQLTRVDGEPVTLDDREFFHIKVPIAGIERRYDKTENIHRWFPYEELAEIARKVKDIDQGAPQKVRKVGRLAYFQSHASIREKVDAAWDQVKNQKILTDAIEHGYEVNDKGHTVSVDFYVGSSLCGGTGSGMVLDLASYIRAQGEETDSPVQLHAYLFLPGAFSLKADEQQMVKANAYAALKEVDFVTSEKGYQLDDPAGGGKKIRVGGKPFPRCFLVDGEQQAGPTLRQVADLAKVVAEAIFLSTCSPVGEKGKSWLEGGVDYLGHEIDGRLAAYSSVGVASQFVPREELLAYSVNRLATQVIDRLLDPLQIEKQESALSRKQLEERRDKEIEDAVRSFLDAHKPEVYLTSLGEVAYGLEVTPGAVGKTSRDNLRAKLLTIRTHRKNELLPEARANVSKRASVLAKEFGNAVAGECERHANNPEEGPNFVRAFLERLRESLKEKSRDLMKHADGLDSQSAVFERKLEAEEKRYGNAANSWLSYNVFRRAARLRGPTSWSRALNESLDNQLNISKLQNVQMIIDTVCGIPTKFEGVTTAQDLHERYAQLCTRLMEMRDEFIKTADRAHEKLVQRQTLFERSLIQPKEVEKLYEGKAPETEGVLERLANTPNAPKIHSWVDEDLDNIKRMFKDHCAAFFDDFKELSLEDGIRLKGTTARDVYDELQGASNPWLSYSEAELNSAGLPGEQKILGIGDRDRSDLIKETKEGVQSAVINDRSQAVFCQLEHGFTVRSLRHIAEYRRAYVDELNPKGGAKMRSLHLDPKFEFWRDPDKEEDILDNIVGGLATSALRFELTPSGKWVLLCADGEQGFVLGQQGDKEYALISALRRLRGDEDACNAVKKAVGTPHFELPKTQEFITSNDDEPGPAMQEILARLGNIVKQLGQARARSYADEPS